MRKGWLTVWAVMGLLSLHAAPLILEYDAGDPIIARAAERIQSHWDGNGSSYTQPHRIQLSLVGPDNFGPQGFRIWGGQNATIGYYDIPVVAETPLGLYYAGTVVCERIRTGADVGAYLQTQPEWERRYAADYHPQSKAQMLTLADANIYGYCWQWRDDWSTFLPDSPTGNWRAEPVSGALGIISETLETGLVDVMFVIHIYMGAATRLDCGDDAMIDAFIDRLRPVAAAGVRHIMIGADDGTLRDQNRYICGEPREIARFGVNNVGQAHGYMMKRVAETLWADYPDLELSFVPPVYSLRGHVADTDSTRVQYLNQFAAIAPDDVMVVWTGPRIIAIEPMTKSDFTQYSNMVPGHQVIYWDNCEDNGTTWAYWNAVLYDGAGADHAGIAMINAHTFGWSEGINYTESANDYLWHQREYNSGARTFQGAFLEILSRRYGPAAGGIIAPMTEIMYSYYKQSPLRITAQSTELDNLQGANNVLKNWSGIPTDRTDGWITSKRSELQNVSRPNVVLPTYTGTPMGTNALNTAFKNAARRLYLGEGDLYVAKSATHLIIGFEGTQNQYTPQRNTIDPRSSTDLLTLDFADENNHRFTLYVNPRNETLSVPVTQVTWSSTLARNGNQFSILIAIPFASLEAEGISTASGQKLYAAMARVYDNWHNHTWATRSDRADKTNMTFPGSLQF